jgi:hypothetical protein
VSRARTSLAMVIVAVRSPDGEPRYVLQLNRHLNGYSFLGGHRDGGETFEDAAVREVMEELGSVELRERWGVHLASPEPVPGEWQRIRGAMAPLAVAGSGTGPALLPFRSLRAGREGRESEIMAELGLFHLCIDRARFPGIVGRLEELAERRVAFGDGGSEQPLCRLLSAAELIEQAWSNPHNPFIRFAVKTTSLSGAVLERTASPHVTDVAALETVLSRSLATLLAGVFGPTAGSAFDLRILAPGPAEPRHALEQNHTLTAEVELRWTGSTEPLRLRLPFPCCGIFVLRSESRSTATRWVWRPRLVARPGLWRLRNWQGEDAPPEQLRLVLSRTWTVDLSPADLEKVAAGAGLPKSLRRCLERLGRSVEPVPEELREWLGGETCPLASGTVRGMDHVADVLRWVAADGSGFARGPHDLQSVEYQRLYTYPVHLLESLLRELTRELLTGSEISDRTALLEAFRVGSPTGPAAARRAWARLLRHRDRLAERIVPLWRLRTKDVFLHPFNPLNPLDAMSGLGAVQRYDLRGGTLERLGPRARQNHPSFRGIFCPVESPESERVGLTLHVARGATIDTRGVLCASRSGDPDRELGWGASLVPFYQHNDGARSMMAAKNLKQAVPCVGSEPPVVTTGVEREVSDATAPATEAGLLSPCREAAPGRNLLVAYMPWYGLNFEDAVVASRTLAEEGMLDWVESAEETVRLWPGVEPVPPTFDNPFEAVFRRRVFDERHLRRPGPISPGDPIAFLGGLGSSAPIPLLCSGTGDGVLIDVHYVEPVGPWMGGSIRWKVERREPLGVGDKIMGRHGNKGVIAALVPPEQLPRLPDDPRLPEGLRARVVDLVLNPHGVVSRMNLGQLLESHAGLLSHLAPHMPEPGIGRAYRTLDAKAVQQAFEAVNGGREPPVIDRYGRMLLEFPGGGTTASPVVVGVQYVSRLSHVAARKANARSHGAESGEGGRLYDSVTGQPVGGRKHRGGQRVGEMEVWALAAHRARENLDGVLRVRSDPSHALRLPEQDLGGQTFEAIRDHLFALGIDLGDTSGTPVPGWATPQAIRARGTALTATGTWEPVARNRYGCPICDYRLPDGFAGTRQPRQTSRSKVRLSVNDLLAGLGYRLIGLTGSGPIDAPPRGRADVKRLIAELEDATGRVQASWRVERKRRTLHVAIDLDGRRYHAYRQADGTISLDHIGTIPLSCPEHTTSQLECAESGVSVAPISAGIYDPAVFGRLDVTGKEPRWGVIELPFPVPYPRNSTGLAPEDTPFDLEVIPVLPLKYRYRSSGRQGASRIPEDHPISVAYVRVLEATRALAGLKRADAHGRKAAELEKRIATLFKLVRTRVFGPPEAPKIGMARRDGLGRRVDGSARLVIVPDPDLPWNECGVPVRVLMDLLAPLIASWDGLDAAVGDAVVERLLEALFPHYGQLVALPASEQVRAWVRSPGFWKGERSADSRVDSEVLSVIEGVILQYLADHPHVRVLLNRQPSLHRYSVMGFRPRLLPGAEGSVLKVNPLVCKAFGADFDGDEMSLHLPGSPCEHVEAEQLEPTAPWNLLNQADDTPLASFDQDFVLGHYLLSRSGSGSDLLRGMLPSECQRCNELLEREGPWLKDHGLELLHHLCSEHPAEAPEIVPEWMRAAFHVATRSGSSFGALELVELAKSFAEDRWAIPVGNRRGIPADELKDWTANIGNRAVNHLRVLATEAEGLDVPGLGYASIVTSRARGDKQSRQVVAARGYLDPGDLGFRPDAERFCLEQPLADGMTPEGAFWAAMNTRSSMIDKKLSTGQAGHITRQLVLAGWPWHVADMDCGATGEVRLARCGLADRKQVCSACYGRVRGLDGLLVGYPAGLIAAQSFGERGTQLSMQSFHTGERQLSAREIQALLDGRDPRPGSGRAPPYNWFMEREDAPAFMERIRDQSAYGALGTRHLLMIWLMIHASPGQSLSSAWEANKTPLTTLIGPAAWPSLLRAIRKGEGDPLNSPFVHVLLGRAPVLDDLALRPVAMESVP